MWMGSHLQPPSIGIEPYVELSFRVRRYQLQPCLCPGSLGGPACPLQCSAADSSSRRKLTVTSRYLGDTQSILSCAGAGNRSLLLSEATYTHIPPDLRSARPLAFIYLHLTQLSSGGCWPLPCQQAACPSRVRGWCASQDSGVLQSPALRKGAFRRCSRQ